MCFGMICDICPEIMADMDEDEKDVRYDEPDDEDEGPTEYEIQRAQDRFEEKVYGDRE